MKSIDDLDEYTKAFYNDNIRIFYSSDPYYSGTYSKVRKFGVLPGEGVIDWLKEKDDDNT